MLGEEADTTKILDGLQRKLVFLVHLLLNKLFQISILYQSKTFNHNSLSDTKSSSFPFPVQKTHRACIYTCCQICIVLD